MSGSTSKAANQKLPLQGVRGALRVIISGGGTGGHIFPAIAIANALKKLDPTVEILFVGANGRMEMEKVPAAGYKIIGLDIQGIQRGSIVKNLQFPLKLVNSVRKSIKIINDFKPDAAVGVGGYASGPLLYAASVKGIPYLIQEQNSYAGITNKWLIRSRPRYADFLRNGCPSPAIVFYTERLYRQNPTQKHHNPAVWQGMPHPRRFHPRRG